ncbi:signal transducer and activator of transcription B [Episyrphus balteatus]|uniref:signal transducer and activator of transcription B n=1 Tax=Episyrphus balteatus TaxID=286459 RepID=UPI002485B0FF|nr:signal transducer and activator of transcription B [Episyrphus balteatus]
MTMNRSNSFVNSLKWWPLQGSNQTNNNNNNNNSNNNSGNHNNNNNSNKNFAFGSSVAVQKLRESKWFRVDERRIFCAVVECGFLVEVRSQNHDENDQSWFGVVLCKTTKDNKPKPETIEIFSVKIRENGTFRLFKLNLEDIWKNEWELRINNFADKEKLPHNEKDIRNQVAFARKAKQSLWHNNKHFSYWCRYGSRQQDVRKRQMSECVKWGSVGMNAGMLLIMNKQKANSTSK